jgi:hypothetical protein
LSKKPNREDLLAQGSEISEELNYQASGFICIGASSAESPTLKAITKVCVLGGLYGDLQECL